MPMFSFVAAAAVAAAPLPPATEADMRCFVALLYAVGTEKTEDKKRTMLAAASYYVGRLDVRLPGQDWGPHIRRLSKADGFFKEIDAEISRCAMESGTALQVAGTTAQNAAKAEIK